MSSSKAVFTFGMTIFCLVALSPCTMSARVPDYINRKYDFIQLQLAFPKPLCNRFSHALQNQNDVLYHISFIIRDEWSISIYERQEKLY